MNTTVIFTYMAECSIHLMWNSKSILVSRPIFTHWLIREAVGSTLHLCNMNRVPSQHILEAAQLLPEEKKLVTSS
jgi:hypothetical protein